MPVSRLNPHRRAKALKYGLKNAAYQLKLVQYRLEKALGYFYPRYAPRGGNGDREYRPTARNFGRPTLFLRYARTRHAAATRAATPRARQKDRSQRVAARVDR